MLQQLAQTQIQTQMVIVNRDRQAFKQIKMIPQKHPNQIQIQALITIQTMGELVHRIDSIQQIRRMKIDND